MTNSLKKHRCLQNLSEYLSEIKVLLSYFNLIRYYFNQNINIRGIHLKDLKLVSAYLPKLMPNEPDTKQEVISKEVILASIFLLPKITSDLIKSSLAINV